MRVGEAELCLRRRRRRRTGSKLLLRPTRRAEPPEGREGILENSKRRHSQDKTGRMTRRNDFGQRGEGGTKKLKKKQGSGGGAKTQLKNFNFKNFLPPLIKDGSSQSGIGTKRRWNQAAKAHFGGHTNLTRNSSLGLGFGVRELLLPPNHHLFFGFLVFFFGFSGFFRGSRF